MHNAIYPLMSLSLILAGCDASASSLPDEGGSGATDVAVADASVARDAATRPLDGSAHAPTATTSPLDGGRDAAASSMGEPAAAHDAGSTGVYVDAGSACSAHGALRYTLAKAAQPSADQTAAYERIAKAMDTAIDKYNCYTDFSRSLNVTYDPGVATADGSENGSIRFGSTESMVFVTAMHEISHTLGIGGNAFKAKVQNKVFTGPIATAKLRMITGKPTDIVNSDGTHIWPYGLNYVTEYHGEADAIDHCAMVTAIRMDLGY